MYILYNEQKPCSALVQQLVPELRLVKWLHKHFNVLHGFVSVADPMQFPIPTTPLMHFLSNNAFHA